MSVMQVLITGSNGQLGQDMQKVLKANSIDYLAADSKKLDISDLHSVRRFFGENQFDVIVNCAAYNAVDLAETQWRTAFRVNGLGVRNLALAAHQAGAIIVHFSSDYIFNGLSGRPYTVADPPSPINRYGESKLLGESYLRDIAGRFILIRSSWVFGMGNDNFPKKTISWSLNKKELRIVHDQISSPTYTVDLARATLDIVTREVFGTYHITNSGYCSRYDWAAYILEYLGWEGNLIPAMSNEFQTAAQRPSFSVLDNLGLRETVGYSLPDWKDATTRFLEELRVDT
jgi:dTDP-4-dehydrorhamnose reductase